MKSNKRSLPTIQQNHKLHLTVSRFDENKTASAKKESSPQKEEKTKKDDKQAKTVAPEQQIEQLENEIKQIEKQIIEMKGSNLATKNGKTIKIEDGKYDKRASDEDEIIYRLAYDFPGFKTKNIKVSVIDRILRIYAFQTSSKKDKDTKEYIYENTTEEILPDEIDVNNITAMFDVENGFLIVEAILPENSDLKAIQKRTSELNDRLFKLEKELEAKRKELSKIKV